MQTDTFESNYDRRANVILSHYAYRSIPFGAYRGWHTETSGPGAAYDNYPVDGSIEKAFLTGVSPRVAARIGQPFFRTTKELGARALASDAWDKGEYGGRDGLNHTLPNIAVSGSVDETQTIPGMGIAAHRQAYNVLYGDGSVRSCGDPRETLIWHTQGACSGGGDPAVGNTQYYSTLARNGDWGAGSLDAWGGRGGLFEQWSRGTGRLFPHTAHDIWHRFDMAAGVDVGVDD